MNPVGFYSANGRLVKQESYKGIFVLFLELGLKELRP
jgi:hypothetical protein